MPKSWYDFHFNKIDKENDTEEEVDRKKFYQKICASKKPYFFAFNYLSLKLEYDKYMENIEAKSCTMFKMSYADLLKKEHKTSKEEDFIQWTKNKMPLDMSPSIMNRICWAVEKEIDALKLVQREPFNCNMIKSGYKYSMTTYKLVSQEYKQYKQQVSNFTKKKKSEYYTDLEIDDDEGYDNIDQLKEQFSEKCVILCPNQYELCDILVDLCYKGRANKDIVWYVCGDVIIENLLKNNNYNMYFPQKVAENEEFWCKGNRFSMKKLNVGGEKDEELCL